MSETDDYAKVELRMYQHFIAKMRYLACGARPDIAFAVR